MRCLGLESAPLISMPLVNPFEVNETDRLNRSLTRTV